MTDIVASFGFELAGPFLRKWGSAREQLRADPKLCFTATDLPTLLRELAELSERPDCVFVKATHRPRAGMHLGRCILTAPGEIGRLWAEYRSHPALFCTVQHDSLVAEFRRSS